MDEVKKEGTNGEVQMSVDGEKVSNELATVTAEQVKEFMQNMAQSLESTMTKVNSNLANLMDGLNLEGLKKEATKAGIGRLLNSLPTTKSLSKMNPANLLGKLPMLETQQEEGKLQVLLNQKKFLEFDLSNFKKE